MRGMDFANRTVVFGVGGGIAAYKACEVARLVVKGRGQVRVAMTRAATHFVGPLAFQAISGAPVVVELLDEQTERGYGHLQLAREADLFLVAPATADLIARLRAGMGDDAVTTTALAVTCPVLLAPAMNTRMWKNPVVQENLAALVARGWNVVGPGAGVLADGDVGEGRLADRTRSPRPPRGCSATSTSPAGGWWSPPARPARPSTRFASSPTRPPGRWASRWRRWRRGGAPRWCW